MGDEEDDKGLELGNFDNYRSGSDLKFSHQALVMKAMNNVLELGRHELCEGINETTTDPRTRVTKIVYKENTKEAYIEAVKTLVLVIKCDFDKDITDNLEALETCLKEIRTELLKVQNNYVSKLNPRQISMVCKDKPYFKQYFHEALPFLQDFKVEELDMYREIFSEIGKLTSRKDFYQGEDFET